MARYHKPRDKASQYWGQQQTAAEKDRDKTRTLENSVKDLTNKPDKVLSSTFKSSNSRVNPILIQGCETGISFMEPNSFIHFQIY